MFRSALTLAAAFAALLAAPLAAQDFPALSGRVVDEANIIDASTEAQLTQKLEDEGLSVIRFPKDITSWAAIFARYPDIFGGPQHE